MSVQAAVSTMKDDKYIAGERGRRVRTARTLAGFTRREFSETHNISLSTLEAWESGRSPLTTKGALRVVNALKASGLYCSLEWLMEEQGLAPRTQSEIETGLLSSEVEQNISEVRHVLDPELIILREVALFRKLNPNSVVLVIVDDGMEPFFARGEYVGGCRAKQENIGLLVNRNCIVETEEGDVLIRRLLPGRTANHYNLACINPLTTSPNPVLFDVKVENVSEVSWHRKPMSAEQYE